MRFTESELAQLEAANEIGIRVEIIAGQPFWEFGPDFRRQRRVFGIESSVRPDPEANAPCECVHASDVGIRFPDGSLRRPDLAIFCREPDETDLITLVPEAVIEVVSQRSREKDLEISPPWYLGMGVKDVLVYDPFTEDVHHFRADGQSRFKTGRTVRLECGCLIDV